MSDVHGSAELAVLLSQLNARTDAPSGAAPSPTEAMAMYFVASRLVELQLELVDRGECDDEELAVTKEVLRGTHRMLSAALDGSGVRSTARPALRVVSSERTDRRRPPGRAAHS